MLGAHGNHGVTVLGDVVKKEDWCVRGNALLLMAEGAMEKTLKKENAPACVPKVSESFTSFFKMKIFIESLLSYP